MRKIPFAGIELTSQRVRGLRGTSELPGRPAYPVINVVVNPVCGLLDRKRSEEHLQNFNESKKVVDPILYSSLVWWAHKEAV